MPIGPPVKDRNEAIDRLRKRLIEMPTPAWRDPNVPGAREIFALRDFQTFRAHQLRSDWSDLEMNLRSVVIHYAGGDWFDLQSAEEAVNIIDKSRSALESQKPNVEDVNDDLGRVRRLIVWLVPGPWLVLQANAVRAQLAASDDPRARPVVLSSGRVDDATLRFQLDDAVGVLNEISADWAINTALQKRRLEKFRDASIVAIVVMIGLSPILLSPNAWTQWGFLPLGSVVALAIVTTFGVAVMGAVAALLSACLQVRDRPTTFSDYQVRGIDIAVRMGVGAIVAVISYLLLSWNAVPILTVAGAGTYLFVAFGAGFSERYFLGLLKIEDKSPTRPPSAVTASSATPVAQTSGGEA